MLSPPFKKYPDEPGGDSLLPSPTLQEQQPMPRLCCIGRAAQLRVPISKKEGTVVAVWPEGVYTDDSFELILFTLIQKYYYCPTKYPKAQNRNALSPKSFRETY